MQVKLQVIFEKHFRNNVKLEGDMIEREIAERARVEE